MKKNPKLTDAERYKRFLDIAKKTEASDRKDDLDKAIKNITRRHPKRTTKPTFDRAFS